jgi:hypothetical protein
VLEVLPVHRLAREISHLSPVGFNLLLFLNISLLSPLNDLKFILIGVCLLSYGYFGLSCLSSFS